MFTPLMNLLAQISRLRAMRITTFGLSVIFIVAIWLFLSLIHGIQRGRVCNSLSLYDCINLAWQQLGDVILFEWLNKWQTLTAGGVALLAAIITAVMIKAQISHSEILSRNQLTRKHTSMRAKLSMEIGLLFAYVESLKKEILPLIHQVSNSSRITGRISQIPTPPESAIATIVDFIETINDDKAKFFGKFLYRIQINDARFRNTKIALEEGIPLVLPRNIISHVIDMGIIQTHCSKIIKYSRWFTDSYPENFTWHDVKLQIKSIWFNSDEGDIIDEYINTMGIDDNKLVIDYSLDEVHTDNDG